MKKMTPLKVMLILLALLASSYYLPTLFHDVETERLTKKVTDAIRAAKENFNRDEHISKLNVQISDYHEAMLGNKAVEDLHHGCIYDPKDSGSEKPLMEGGFRFLENIDNTQIKNIDVKVVEYQAKYPRALFMVDFFSVLITRDPEGNILHWNKPRTGFSIWYAPENALDFICPVSGVIFS